MVGDSTYQKSLVKENEELKLQISNLKQKINIQERQLIPKKKPNDTSIKVIANLSSLELLKLKSFLENPQLQEMLQNIPVRKDSEIWEPCTEEMYAGRAIVQSPILRGTKKSITKTQYILEDPNVQKLGSATHYQPQIAVKDTVMELGDYTMQRFSGEWTPRQRALALQRRSTLLSATIAALKTANEVEEVKSELDSEWLLKYLQGK